MLKRFKKKPVEIQAIQLTRKNVYEILGFLGDAAGRTGTYNNGEFVEDECFIEIITLEGSMMAQENDWIIRGISGEFYPCKPDIFALTYEEVSS
jgi:hypothetical protein